MSLFRRIFNFEKAKVDLMEQRLNQRYTPGPSFPMQVRLRIADRDWPAKIVNLSGNGLGLRVEAAAQPVTGQTVQLGVTLPDHDLLFDAQLVQVRPEGKVMFCGTALIFSEFPAQKTWLQLLQPVAIGQSLQAVPAERVIQNEPQFIKQVFRGDEQSVLTVWLDKSFGTPLHSFEFQMHDYFCHADAKAGVLEAYAREATDSHKGKLSNPVFDTSGDLHAEIRQLFRWILPNLGPAVPDDVRAFLQRFAT